MDQEIYRVVAVRNETENDNHPGFAAGTRGGCRPASRPSPEDRGKVTCAAHPQNPSTLGYPRHLIGIKVTCGTCSGRIYPRIGASSVSVGPRHDVRRAPKGGLEPDTM